jgi:hypothetical protein
MSEQGMRQHKSLATGGGLMEVPAIEISVLLRSEGSEHPARRDEGQQAQVLRSGRRLRLIPNFIGEGA